MRILPKQLKLINNSEIKLYDTNLEFVDIDRSAMMVMLTDRCVRFISVISVNVMTM